MIGANISILFEFPQLIIKKHFANNVVKTSLNIVAT